MRLNNPQAKGKGFEREIAKYLEKEFNTVVRRTPCSGGLHNFMAQDIICQDQESVLYKLHIECKKCEKLNVWEVFEKNRKLAPVGKIPVVVWSKNFAPQAIVAIGQYDFFNLLKAVQDAKIEI